MDYGYKTDKGQIREQNEDRFLFCDKKDYVLLAVADGMGGHNAGELASTLAIEAVRSFHEQTGFGGQVEEKLLQCVSNANQRVYRHALSHPDSKGMGTTLTLAVLLDRRIVVAHVGDSRAYVINEGIRRLTVDHSYVEELRQAGKISDEEAKTHPRRNQITRALGTELTVTADIVQEELEAEAVVLLCSDGLTNMIEEKEIFDCVKNSATMQEAMNQLTKKANENGGTDNITVVGLKLGENKQQTGLEGDQQS